MAKRVLTRLRLDKIAAVGSPCQAPAIAAIIKRAPDAPVGPKAIAKATFEEALQANMTADAVNDAFYQSFDGLWERNDAFRRALTDELAEGGDGTVASAAYVASVKALVDTAVTEARNAGATASDTSNIDKALSTAAAQWLKSRQQEQTTMIIKSKADLRDAIAKFDPTKSSVADRDAIVKAATDLNAEDELPAEGALAKAKTAPDADLVRKVAILEMPADVRKHFDGLDATAQTAFLAKSAEDRAADVAKLNEADPVLYKTAAGREIRKSHGQLAADLARDNDELRGDITKLKTSSAGDQIAKRLADYPHVAKKVSEPLIKSALAMTDTAEQAAVFESLASMNKAASGAFQRFGNAGGGTALDIAKGEADPDSPQGRMDAIVKRKMEADPKLDKAQATVAVLVDPEYQAAYNDSLADVPVVGAPAQ